MPQHVYIGTVHLTLGNVLNPNIEVMLEQPDAITVVLTFANTVVSPAVYSHITIAFPETQLAFKGSIVKRKRDTKWTCLTFEAQARG